MSMHIHDIKATGTIQGSKLTAKQAITGTTLYLNESIRFLRKSTLTGGWISNFSIAQSDNGSGIISAADTINIRGSTINIEGELLINGEAPLINIAGTDINVWGGTLSASDLITSLQTNGIKANALIVDQEIGNNTTPVYFSSSGIPIACNNVHATSAISAESASKLNTSAGNENTPVYFEDGVPIACTSIYATTDVAKKLIDDNNNNLTAGSSNTPVYFNNGIPMECTDLTTRNITANTLELSGNDGQGGKLTLSNGIDKIGELMINPLTNTFASICYLPPDKVINGNGATLLSETYIKGRENYTCGTIFPSVNLEEGQIFFKINENGTKENETDKGYWITVTPYIYRFNNETI